jgi:hypothetical protein
VFSIAARCAARCGESFGCPQHSLSRPPAARGRLDRTAFVRSAPVAAAKQCRSDGASRIGRAPTTRTRGSPMTRRHLYRTTLVLLVTLILVRGSTLLDEQAPFGARPLPSLCRLAVAYLPLPALGHDPCRPAALTKQLVVRLERIVGRCVDSAHHASAPAYDDGRRRPTISHASPRRPTYPPPRHRLSGASASWRCCAAPRYACSR